MKEALQKHQDSLLDRADSMLSSLSLSGPSVEASSWTTGAVSVTTEASSGRGTKAKRARREKDFSTVQDLLRQHLRTDKLWKVLAQREEALKVHAAELSTLRDRALTILTNKTGYRVVPLNVTSPAPFVYSSAVDLFFKEAISRASGGESAPIEVETIIDANHSVKYHNLILAEAPGHEEQCKLDLMEAFRAIGLLPEVRRVVDAYKELERANSKARQPLEQLLLVGLVPGQCEVCRRLGL